MLRRLVYAALVAAAAADWSDWVQRARKLVEVHDCHDVQKWIKDGQTGLFQPKMDCDWVAQDKEKRCKQWGEVIADEVCRASCGHGGGVNHPSFRVVEEVVEESTTTLRGGVGSRGVGLGSLSAPNFALQKLREAVGVNKRNANRDCDWVAQNPEARCGERGAVLAEHACHAACWVEKIGNLAEETSKGASEGYIGSG
mmetsp:Transcript_351/g.1097  ORF Transcript_351/g.1097 Transcript_351/m.1097 type:complete len:198 (-) Transcript_351:111-704(-)